VVNFEEHAIRVLSLQDRQQEVSMMSHRVTLSEWYHRVDEAEEESIFHGRHRLIELMEQVKKQVLPRLLLIGICRHQPQAVEKILQIDTTRGELEGEYPVIVASRATLSSARHTP